MTIRTIARETDLPANEVERLLSIATGWERAELALGRPLRADQLERFIELTTRRCQGEPLQYLEGTVQFGPVEVAVDPRVLIPRPETEYILELVADVGVLPDTIVDLGTGSGNLALALKHEYPTARVLGVDRSGPALAVARSNSSRLELALELLEGDLFAPLPGELRGAVDLVVANPPYVSDTEFEQLPSEIREHEPREALVAGPRGVEVLERIAREVSRWLRSGGWILCEIGETQADVVEELFSAELTTEVRLDLADKPRYIVGHTP